MATRQLTIDHNVSRSGGAKAVTWTGLLNTDDGAPLAMSEWSERTFQVFGTFGTGGTLVIEGSNNGTTWNPVSNRAGSALSYTAAGINRTQDYPLFVRPRVTAGDGTTNLTVIAAIHRVDLNEGG